MRKQADGAFDGWLLAARDGDATAWSNLYHDVAPLVIGYLRAQRLPDPEDVAGEVLLEVVRDLHRFEGTHRNFRSWVLAIAHHRLLDARRRLQRSPADPRSTDDLLPTPASDNVEAESLATIGLGELAPALARLTEEQRTVLLLRVIGDLSIADVAVALGKQPGAIKQLQRRAVDAMRRSLDAGHGRTDRRGTDHIGTDREVVACPDREAAPVDVRAIPALVGSAEPSFAAGSVLSA